MLKISAPFLSPAQKSPHCIDFPRGTIAMFCPLSARQNTETTMRLNNLLMGGVLASAIALAGCGTSPGDRAVSGGMIGAGAGAIIGAATGTPATGAAIGAAAGALVGAATDPCDLDLGKPFWRDHGGRAGYEKRCGHPPPG
jgi:hypothetical protein